MVQLLTVIYDSAIDETMTELLAELRVSGYTKIFDTQGLGGRGRNEHNPGYPGHNHGLLIAAPEEETRRIVRSVRRLQDTFRLRPGVTMILQDAELAV